MGLHDERGGVDVRGCSESVHLRAVPKGASPIAALPTVLGNALYGNGRHRCPCFSKIQYRKHDLFDPDVRVLMGLRLQLRSADMAGLATARDPLPDRFLRRVANVVSPIDSNAIGRTRPVVSSFQSEALSSPHERRSIGACIHGTSEFRCSEAYDQNDSRKPGHEYFAATHSRIDRSGP
jgi:hypothetical protein